jgi:sugar lactone lactonase YvrE
MAGEYLHSVACDHRGIEATGLSASELAALSVSPEASTNQTVTAGHDVTLSAPEATGALRWRVSSDFGRTWTNLTEGGNYRGVTSNALTISSATPAMDTLLYLIAATANGVTTYPSMVKLAVVSEFLPYPAAIASDAQGVLFVADGISHTINKISTASVLSVFAGTARQTGSTDASGAAARFNDPQGLVMTAGGGVFVADTGNAEIRSITSAGVVSTLATSTFAAPAGIAQDSLGNLYVADGTDHTIRKITATGIVSIFAGAVGVSGSNDGAGTAAHFNHPTGLAVDGNDTVYVSDTGNNLIRKITPAGDVTTLVGASAELNHPGGLTVDGGGNVYLADTGNSVVRRITPDGGVSILAGVSGVAGLKDGEGNEAWFNRPRDVCLDAQGVLYVDDTGNAIVRRVAQDGKVTTMSFAPLTWMAAPETPVPPVTPPTTPPASSSSNRGGGGASGIWFLITLVSAWLVRRAFPRRNRRAA